MPEETPPEGEQTPVVPPVVEPPTLEEIAAQAQNPDAVSNAIKAERERAKAERERANQEKEAREAAEARIKEFEDAQKSEEERREEALKASEERAAAAEARAADLEIAKTRSEVAAEKNLPPRLAARLSGKTREEIEADADSLLEDLGTLPGETPPPGDGGVRTPVQPKDLQEQIREAEAAGDTSKSMSLKTQAFALGLGQKQ